jgi:hypothetical protein
MTTTTKFIQIDWDGPYSFEDAKALRDDFTDYGIYQIYGTHPVYGNDVLLYIGKAYARPFGVRLSEERWGTEYETLDTQNIRVHVGRLAAAKTPEDDVWEDEVELAEKLLIHVHSPAYNSSNIGTIPDARCAELHILNWGNHRSLLPEVSGARWTNTKSHALNENGYFLYGDDRRESSEI